MDVIFAYSTALYFRPATNFMICGEFVTASDIRMLESIGYEVRAVK